MGGARLPAWGPNGELYYWQTGEGVLRVIRTRQSGGQLTVAEPQSVWQGAVAAAVLNRIVITLPNGRFDVDPSGARFVVLERSTPDAPPGLRSPIVVLGSSGSRTPGTPSTFP
jgi:hypothetical protein